MKKCLYIVLVLMLTAGFAKAQDGEWFTDPEMAKQKAIETGKPIFADFMTTWCSYCTKLDQTTFQDPSFKDVAQNFVLLKVDGDIFVDFRKAHNVKAYPTMVFFKITNDAFVEFHQRVVGYVTAATLVPIMQAALLNDAMRVTFIENDIAEAFRQANAQNRLVFVVVSGSSCPWCDKLKKETLPDPTVIAQLENYVCMLFDYNHDVQWCKNNGVTAVPTMLFFKKDRTLVYSIRGFKTAADLAPILKRILAENPQFSLPQTSDFTFVK